MPDATCTSEQAIQAVGYLRLSFGGYAIPEAEDRALVRLFRNYPPAELQEAIDELAHKRERRPGPSEIAEHIRIKRRAANPQPTRDPIPDDPDRGERASRAIAAIREQVPAINRGRRSA